MSTQSKVDLATLGWVRNEIDETLKQARLALESFLESPSDDTRLRFCITHLHQVVGTLLMVELDGAARLAKEAESLAEAMLADNSLATHDNLATLTRALVVLPDYLARLQAGQPDVPLRHLSILNELRTAHGVEALRELDLFSPDLSARPPRPEGEERLDEAGYAALARQLRPALQADLLAWLRDSRRQDALEDIGGLFEQLQVRAPAGPFEQLFWVAGGLIEALREGGLEASAERKKFFARLDQQLKKIIDGSERSQLRKLSEELVRGMLFELGT
ncbi:MAG: Hpt domain-containing protein, partial [Pseudomonadota bacterium]